VGEFPLLDHVDFEIKENEKIALIGRNGEGKSTLLKILSGALSSESGEIVKAPYVQIARLAQDLPGENSMTVYKAVAKGLKSLSDLLIEYHTHTLSEPHDEPWLNKISKLQQEIEQLGGWEIQQRIEKVITALELPPDAKLSTLSGGWRKRVALAQVLVQEPDVLLLDEPTNHLDIEAIIWLESFLMNYPKTLIFITHDRALLRKVATQIIELDRGHLTSYPGDYDRYLARKEQALIEEERHNALFDKKLSEEEKWVRQGIKARRTRNEGRVRALKVLRDQRKQRRQLQGKVKMAHSAPIFGGKSVVQAENVSFGYEKGKPIIQNFTFNIEKGDKIAIVGANGSGKTTLVKLLVGLEEPNTGKIKLSPTLKAAFFDQNRAQINPDETLSSNVCEGDDFVEISGKKKHIVGYLGDFLFAPKKCHSLASTLSGGEQNRLLLAKLFAKPANVLILDEPTNDLDIETLDVLENLLLNYSGTLILISHDREFIDNIATHCIAIEPSGKISINVGGYSDWLARKPAAAPKPKKQIQSKIVKKEKGKKLNFKEHQALKELPALIEKYEHELSELQKVVCEPDFYNKAEDEIQGTQDRLKNLEEEIAKAYLQWEALESIPNK